MVGAMKLLKILHSNRLNSQHKTSGRKKEDNETSSYGESSQQIDIKEEKTDVEVLTNTCRVCLKEGNIPIYGSISSADIAENLATFGAIEISIDDVYPKYLCQTCHALLEGAILFRKTAQESDQVLRQPIYHTKTDDDVELADTDDNFNSDSEEDTQKKPTDNYQCKRCDLYFETFEEYDNHRLSDEHENLRHTCPYCHNSYKAMYFKRHLSLHKVERPYMCDVCGKKFIIQGQFNRHRLTHFYDLPYKCSLCPYRGRFSESLKMHMRTHTGEKPYQCAQCASRFVNKSNLNKHMKTHNAKHDFRCETCGRGFHTKRNLELHFKVDHTGIKDHICNICGKPFGYRKQMMKHQLKVHKREKMRSGRLPLYLQVESKKQRGEKIPT